MYTLILTIDANFHLKRHAMSNNMRDPDLISGYRYFVQDGPYWDHILNYADQEDVSTAFLP